MINEDRQNTNFDTIAKEISQLIIEPLKIEENEEEENEENDYKYPHYYSSLFNNPNDIKYYRSDECDMGSYSSIIPFPKIISVHYMAAQFKAAFGCFPEIDRFYCTIDNKIFLWTISNKEPEQKMEDAGVICCTCLCGVDPLLPNYTPSFCYTLAVATPKYIKIYNIHDSKVCFDEFYTTEINFAPSCMAAGPLGQIFVGADCGRIFLLKYDESDDTYKVKLITKNLSISDWTYGIFPRLLRIIGYSTPFLSQIVYDSSLSYIAAIDENSHLRFFNYDVVSNSCTVLSFQDSDKYKVSSVCSVPTRPANDDYPQPHFIAFCEDGTRLLIEKKNGRGLTFEVRKTKPPPKEFDEDQVVCAQSFMGLTIIVGKKKIITMRNQRYKRKKESNLICEFVSSKKLTRPGLFMGVANVEPDFTDPLIWQHNRAPPTVYILTSAGGYEYRFSTPSDELSRLVISTRGKYDINKIDNYISISYDSYETIANAILASFKHPECDGLMINMITQYSHKNYINLLKQNSLPSFNPNKLSDYYERSDVILGIIVRITRLLEPLWGYELFFQYPSKKGKNKCRVNGIFCDISPSLIRQLEHVNEWMDKYLKNLISNTKTVVAQTSTLISVEQHGVKILSSFVDTIIEILSFLSILGIQKKQFITDVIHLFEIDKTKKREVEFLLTKKFGDCMIDFYDTIDENTGTISIGFFNTLKEFTNYIFNKTVPSNELDNLSRYFNDKCPSLAQVENSRHQIYDAIDRLVGIQSINPTQQEKEAYLPIVVNPFIEYADLITIEKLDQIVSLLVLMDSIPFAVKIIEAKVKSIDPSNRAIQYFKNANDNISLNFCNEIFDFLRQPLSIIENEPNGIEQLMKSELEIIHIFVFSQLYISNPDILYTLDSPYILDYLTYLSSVEQEKHKSDFLWKYFLIHKDKKRVCKELVNRFSVTSKEKFNFDLKSNERNQMLQIALRFARNNNASIDEIDEICKAIDKVNNSKKQPFVDNTISNEDNDEKCREEFKRIDKDGNGELDRGELMELLNDRKQVNEIFAQFDNKKTLNFTDFVAARRKISWIKTFNELVSEEKKKGITDDTLGLDKLKEFYTKTELISLLKPLTPKEYLIKFTGDESGRLDFNQAIDFLFED